ncbi:MAG: threonine synthase [Anaerolineales bacterium]
MAAFLGYRCSGCGREFPPDPIRYTCPDDGSNLDVALDLAAVQRRSSPDQIERSQEGSMWRYLPLLPVGDPGLLGTPLRSAGGTPFFECPRLAKRQGLRRLWLKDDGRNPTASFKDRASALVVVRAREIGAEKIVTASTGNAGAALAGMAAAAQMPAVIFAPRTAPPAKVAQLLVFGAQVFLVDGSYDDAFDLTIQASQAFGWYCRNTGYNPFTAEGKKTGAFEIAEQFHHALPGSRNSTWEVPDAVFVSVGDGNILSGIHKGFRDLAMLGWIERLPRLYGVQAEGSAAIAHAFAAGEDTIRPVKADTLADSISVDLPRDGLRALRAVRDSGGAFVTVPDEAILHAIAELGREAAVFAEPAGAAAYAGLAEAIRRDMVGEEDRIVVLITGSGLKDVPAALRSVGEAPVIAPTLEAVRKAMA